jgi:ATP-dependent RNA helicase DDX55/SPB4
MVTRRESLSITDAHFLLLLTLLQWSTYAFQDKARETKRLTALTPEMVARRQEEIQGLKTARASKRKRNVAWSVQSDRVQEREKRKVKKGKRREAIKKAASGAPAAGTAGREGEKKLNETGTKSGPGGVGSGQGLDDGRDEDSTDEWDALAREERMAKKVKKGLVDKTTFERTFGLDGLD